MIFEAYGDPIKKIILELLLKQPKSIPESNIPNQTSASISVQTGKKTDTGRTVNRGWDTQKQQMAER